MRNIKAVKLRKIIYGNDFSPKFRKYKKSAKGQIISDEKRQMYQKAKKQFRNKEITINE